MPIFRVLVQDAVALGVVQRPEGILPDVDAVQRRLRQKHLAARDELRQVSVEEGQEERRDVVAVRVGVGEDDDLAVAKPAQVEVVSQPAAEGRDQIGELLVFEHLRQRGALSIQHLSPQRQNRLTCPVAPLLGRPAGRIAFDDEELAAVARGVRAVAQFAGKIQARGGCALARHFGLRRAARLARPRREDDARDDRLGDGDVVIQPVLERRTNDAVDARHELGIIEPILGLPLELRFLNEQAHDSGQAFSDVLGGNRHALGREIVRVDEVPHGLVDAGPQAAFVSAARRGRNAVDVRAHVLIGRLRPLQHEIEPQSLFLVEHERRVVHRLGAPFGDDLLQVIDEAFDVLKNELLLGRLVLEGDFQALVQIAGDLEPGFDDFRVEFDVGKNGGIGMEVDRGAAAARGANLLQRSDRLALLEAHFPLRPVAFDGGDELLRQGVDDAGADAVQAAGRFVAAVLELAAGMEHREDHFEGALLRRGMLVDRNPAPIVRDRDRRSIAMKRHPDIRGEAIHRLVDGVVEDFPHEVVQSGRADATDVHAGAFADRIEPFKNGDVFGGVVRGCHTALRFRDLRGRAIVSCRHRPWRLSRTPFAIA